MRETTSRLWCFRCVIVLLGLSLAFSATACNGGPTEPSFDDLVRIHTGRWRGNINGLEVVLDVHATKGSAGVGIEFGGTGTARSATGESHRLRINGGALVGAAGFSISAERGGETGPGSVILITTGDFAGEVSGDGRTWPGRFTSATAAGAAPIFGLGQYDVTFLKD